MRKISVNKNDPFRVLLTELLPYETPVFFSNEGFYRFCLCRMHSCSPILRKLLLGYTDEDAAPDPGKLKTIPYNYEIRKGEVETRALSVMHPAAQLLFVDLYKDFAHVILHACSKSSFSLRHPTAVGSAFYGKEETGDEEDVQYASNYFEYEKYPFLHRFFGSYEFIRLEKRFHHLRTFDISKCFNHIYTHTLSWAVKSKAFAKVHIGRKTFDSCFDGSMQAANHGETAGILIGPEVSRIFAEIILQKVDSLVEARMKSKALRKGIDYDICRYVDDYFVFSRISENGQMAMQIYHEELKKYRLYFNEAKSEELAVPFMTAISCAKIDLSHHIGIFFQSLGLCEPKDAGAASASALPTFRGAARKARNLIQAIKATTKTHGVPLSSITGFALSILEKRLVKTLQEPETAEEGDKPDDEALGRLLVAFLDISFFLYAMDVRVSNTYKVTRIALLAAHTVKACNIETADAVRKRIHDESTRILEVEITSSSRTLVEVINLMALKRVLGDEYALPPEKVSALVQYAGKSVPDPGEDAIDYFMSIAVLFHIGNDSRYVDQKAELERTVIDLFKSATSPFNHADFTCLFFDLLSCPFLSEEFKKSLLSAPTFRGRKLRNDEKEALLTETSSHQWFANWRARDSIEVLLEKKKYRTPY